METTFSASSTSIRGHDALSGYWSYTCTLGVAHLVTFSFALPKHMFDFSFPAQRFICSKSYFSFPTPSNSICSLYSDCMPTG